MTEPVVIRLDTAEGFIRAIPHLLGFHPTESVVLVLRTDARVSLTGRVDLPPPGAADEWAREVSNSLSPDALAAATGAHVLVVSAQHRPDVVDAAQAMLVSAGLSVSETLHTETTRPGAPWHCACSDPDCTSYGTLSGDTSEIEVHAALRGWDAPSDRASRLARVEPGDPHDLTRRAGLFHNATPAPLDRLPEELAEYRAGQPLDDRRIIELVTLLNTTDGYQATFDMIMDGVEGVGEFLMALTRETPDAQVSAVASLAGLWLYVDRGDGLTARHALHRAVTADPDNTIGYLLLTAVDAGIGPTDLRTALARPRSDRDTT